MAVKGFMQQLRKMYEAFYDGYGNLRVEPKFIDDRDKGLTSYRVNLLKHIVKISIETSITGIEAKAYIKTNCSYRELKMMFEDKDESYKNISQPTFVKRITDSIDRIEKLFGQDALTDIRYYPNKDVKYIEDNIVKAYAKFSECSKLRNEMLFKVSDQEIFTEFDDTDGDFCTLFKEALNFNIKNLKKENKRFNSNCEAVGYFNYLLSGMETTDEKVLRDREYLIDILSGNEIKFKYGSGENAIYPFGKIDDSLVVEDD